MKQKATIPTWLWIVAGVLGVWIYSNQASKPVSSLPATTTESRSVYAGPNVNYGVIGQLAANSRIILTGKQGDAWVTFNFNGQQGWIQEFFLDIDGKVFRLPEVAYVPVLTPTTMVAKDQFIRTFLRSIINDTRYDPSSNVLHKYLNALDIKVSGSVLTYTLWSNTDTPDELVMLASDLIFASALASRAGEVADWNLTKVELYWPGPQQSYARLYVSGHDNIVSIAQNQAKVYDIMETDVSYGGVQQSPSSDNSPTAPCTCASNAYNCNNFSSHAEAQACFNYCLPSAGDIHWLDDDGDGQACEFLP